ncbi:MAG: sigma-70 family RNA polymerase sigma factor [Bacteroidales bacterium]|jgi:RNA polymerase sigma-70 factor (ECF subfamily)|nr:sigma-70 family RNA polymerase sigma factor [Bacteroidales bacterium]MDD4236700.1 sigma-70 family RNA polymerase sigma factor [Bacteroidales bacterium]MDY0160402.1 sigma-70 family RNA polymerase sigma factor [Bacteroidales bacterium]
MSDTISLIKKCQSKSPKAFDKLYKKYSGMMFSICLRYTKNSTEAEDLLQDCFIRVFNKISDFKFCGSFEGWLRKLTITTALNHINAKKLLLIENIGEYKIINETSAFEDIIAKMSADEILKKIQQLPQGYRVVFNLFAIEGYKHREIAELLNISENTSKSQYLKARKALIELIEEK